MIKIIQKRIGYSNVTLIVNGENSVLVDTGVKGHLKQIQNLFNRAGLRPSDIKLIVLTHTHYDHTGNLIEMVKLTGAKVVVHKNEYENLKKGFTPIPKGTRIFSRFVAGFGKRVRPKFASPVAFTADIITEDEFDLNEFGLNAKIIHTPGHSMGSQAVLIGKIIIAGDAFVNMKNGYIFPPFANNPDILLQTWQKIFGLGIEEIYPGHGPKFKVEKAMPHYKKWKQKLAG